MIFSRTPDDSFALSFMVQNMQPFENPIQRSSACNHVAFSKITGTTAPSGICLAALESLERICETLSSSDLGSLEVTSDDEQSGTCTNDEHVNSDEEEVRETLTLLGLRAKTKRSAKRRQSIETSIREHKKNPLLQPHDDKDTTMEQCAC